MDIKYHPNATHFLSYAGKYLAKDEARYGLIMGLAGILQKNPQRFGKEEPWFCSIKAQADLNAVAMRTPPFYVLMAYFSGDINAITECLLTTVSKKYTVIPGVVGDKKLTDFFTKRWCEVFGVSIQHTMAQRIYRLDKVNPAPLSEGYLRLATESDAGLVLKWARTFNLELYGNRREEMPEHEITLKINRKEAFLWEDRQPVSMAFKTRPTDKDMAINYVYTPLELRRKGYATSCVVELCRHILRSGKEFCTLYTDLSNPVSNSIYKKIGFNEVGDSVEYTFKIPKAKKV